MCTDGYISTLHCQLNTCFVFMDPHLKYVFRLSNTTMSTARSSNYTVKIAQVYRFFSCQQSGHGKPLCILCRKRQTDRPWVVGQNYFVSWHPSGEHLVYGLFERNIDILLPKKVPKQKTCQILRKRVICDYLPLNRITAKKFEILNPTITKTTCTMRKSTKNYI